MAAIGAPRVKEWVTVATLSGTGGKQGATFTLQGGQQRLRWSCSMPATSYVGSSTFMVVTTATNTTADGSSWGDCETQQGAPSSQGDSLQYVAAGTYYFGVNATPNNTWTVTIEELR